ncbi:MAG: NifB/NifX family molybdenum-iron cluster-binding protein [Deltaproteobacteria bacterium]|nr:NifB/NifX family molybdenum-iron cluster-binding protein [Deltaproteobacteria bacterium]
MIVAMPVWNERIAPLFDVCQKLRLAEIEKGFVVSVSEMDFCQGEPSGKALQLEELGVAVLICGAISRPVQSIVTARNIQVIPFISGVGTEVIEAWLNGSLDDPSFVMPGCCGRRKRCRSGKETVPRGRGGKS